MHPNRRPTRRPQRTAGVRSAYVQIPVPEYVPEGNEDLWRRAAQSLQNKNQLRTASGHINNRAVHAKYTEFLRQERTAQRLKRPESSVARSSSRSRQASQPWAFKDLSFSEFMNMARTGDWEGVRKAADMVIASRRKK